jgi:hypothetical protein
MNNIENKFNESESKEIDRISQKVILILKEGKKINDKQIKQIAECELKSYLTNNELEDWQVYYSKERIVNGVLTNKLFNEGKGNLSLSWFNFYINFRLPLGIILGILSMITFITLGEGILFILVLVTEIVLAVILFWGLRSRELWAYKMNFVILVLETLLMPLRFDGFMGWFIGFIILVIGWLLPNWIYFKKRKYLFSFSYIK